jgi:hypothetical protein
MDAVRAAGLGHSRVRDFLLFSGGLVLAVVLHAVDPSDATAFPICPFYALTGLHCPGCGTLRCLHALLHTDLRSAVDYNILTVVFAPLLVVAWLSIGLTAITGRQISVAWSAPRWLAWAAAVGFGLFWFLRNLPFAPFSWLAP